MNRQQRKFLTIVAALVALFLLVTYLLRPRPEAAPAPGSPTPTSAQPALETSRPATVTPVPLPTGVTEPPAAETPVPLPAGTTPAETGEGPRAFFVAVDGTKEGDGSIDEPWPLQYALNHPGQVRPGDTIWLRGGVYEGEFVLRLEGEEGRPITVRAYPGERVTLANDDLVLDISTSRYVNLWGLEITATTNSRDPHERPETAYGIRINQGKPSHHLKWINMIIHDMPAQGFAWWRANTDSELYGSLIYFNGVNQFDHGVYLMNETGEKRMVDNIIFDNASHGIHAYGEKEEQKLNNLHIKGNTVFNNGSIGYSTTLNVYGDYKRNILVGGRLVAENPVIRDNMTYYPNMNGEALNLGYRAGSRNAVVEDNYFAGGTIALGGENSGMTMTENTILGFGLSSFGSLPFAGNDLRLFKPRELKVFVRPNQYEAGRANITIYNWPMLPTVRLSAADLEGVGIQAGDSYDLHNVQDFYGDVISGTYDGEAIEIPMTGRSVAQPLGLSFKPASTFPEFGAFVLITKGQ